MKICHPRRAAVLAAFAAAGLVQAPARAQAPEPVQVGAAVAWGVSTAYEGLPTDQRFLQVATGWDHTVALLPDGSIVVYGTDTHASGENHAEKPAGTDFVAVATGQFHSLALRADGTAVAWGGGFYEVKGQIDIPLDTSVSPPRPYEFAQVDGGELFSVGVTTSGELVAWGGDYCPWDPTDVPVAPAGARYLAVSTSGHHVLALRSDGALDGWGIDVRQPPAGCAGYQRNQSDYPFEPAPVAGFSAGHAFSFTLDDGGHLRAWGLVTAGPPPRDRFGEVLDAPVGERFSAVCGGYYHATAIRPNGLMVAWGKNDFAQAMPPADVRVSEVSSKYDHGVALLACYADFQADQRLDFLDFLAFLNAFSVDDPSADCDDDRSLSFLDFLCFQDLFETGCVW